MLIEEIAIMSKETKKYRPKRNIWEIVIKWSLPFSFDLYFGIFAF